LQPFNLTSAYQQLEVTIKPEESDKYSRIYHVHERNIHPFDYLFDYDIFFEKDID